MFSYEFPRDQHLCQFRIGLEVPVADTSLNFFVPGHAQLGHPRVSVSEYCQGLKPPALFIPGDDIPLIYVRQGIVQFGKAKWGMVSPSGCAPVILRKAERRSLGFPAMIPASYIDLVAIEGGGQPMAVRLRPRDPSQHLYLGCAFIGNMAGDAQGVIPLICRAGGDIAPFADWQPLLIGIQRCPMEENFDFLLRKDNGRLQAPLPSGSVNAEFFSLEEVEAAQPTA